jgi:hypothetical protein
MKFLQCLLLLTVFTVIGAQAAVVSYRPLDVFVDDGMVYVTPDVIGTNGGVNDGWWLVGNDPSETPPQLIDGMFGKAVYTGDGHVDCNNDISLNPGAGSLTFAFWLKGISFPEGYNPVLGRGSTSYICYRNATNNDLMMRINNSDVLKGGGSAITGEWRHYAVVLNIEENIARYYVNGNIILENSYSGLDPADASTFCIGVGGGDKLSPMNGYFDDVVVFNEPLSSDQIAGLMNGYGTKAFFQMENSAVEDSSFFSVTAIQQGSLSFVTGADNRGDALSLGSGDGFTVTVEDSTQLTLAALIKSDTFVDAPILAKGGVLISTNADGTVRFSIGANSLNSAVSLQSGNWASVIATYDGSDMRLYINGRLDSTLAVSGANVSGTALTVGGGAFIGTVDDVKYSDYAFIQSDVDKESAGFANLPPVIESVSASEDAFWLDTNGSKTIDITGSVSDDGLSGMALTTTWSSDGPAGVAFGDAEQLNTTATFTTYGDYILTLTADDGEFQVTAQINVTVYTDDFTGLVAHWNLDETAGTVAADSVGNNDGAVMNTVEWVAEGQKGGAIDLKYATSYINVPSSSEIQFSKYMTVAFWVKGSLAGQTSYACLIGKEYRNWRISKYGGQNNLLVTVGASNSIGGPEIVDDDWHHIVMTYNNKTMSVYHNGYLYSSGDFANALNDTGTFALQIGNDTGNPGMGYAGLVDEVRLYSICLPADKVLDLYVADGGQVVIPTGCDYYIAGDLSQDCYVNLDDFRIIAANWLDCNEKSDPNCTHN